MPERLIAIVGPENSGKIAYMTDNYRGVVYTVGSGCKLGFLKKRKLKNSIDPRVLELLDQVFQMSIDDVFGSKKMSRGQVQMRELLKYLLVVDQETYLLSAPFVNLDILAIKKLLSFFKPFLDIVDRNAVITSTDDKVDFADKVIRL